MTRNLCHPCHHQSDADLAAIQQIAAAVALAGNPNLAETAEYTRWDRTDHSLADARAPTEPAPEQGVAAPQWEVQARSWVRALALERWWAAALVLAAARWWAALVCALVRRWAAAQVLAQAQLWPWVQVAVSATPERPAGEWRWVRPGRWLAPQQLHGWMWLSPSSRLLLWPSWAAMWAARWSL